MKQTQVLKVFEKNKKKKNFSCLLIEMNFRFRKKK